ncbi:NAD(P)-binding domain-containing protein [Arthrobacter sp. Bi83]|nr:NAD(P)-binding domain-containing protein [Arthrobacter sp. Bi83]
MKIGIIGRGNIGAALARKLAAAGNGGEAGGLEGA